MEEAIKLLLENVVKGKITVNDAMEELKFLPFKDIFHTKLDTHRQLRTGIEEVVFGAGKDIEDILEIVSSYLEEKKQVLITRLTDEKAQILLQNFPFGKYMPKSKIFTIKENKELTGKIAILSAGTSDIPVAEEASVTAEFFGSKTTAIYDVGIAGIHRLVEFKHIISEANIIVAVAGMDGALPAVVAGMFGKPVVAVPTSVGYGASFNGIAPLLTMLNSCAPGVVTVNIDNGFGAGVFAHMINRNFK